MSIASGSMPPPPCPHPPEPSPPPKPPPSPPEPSPPPPPVPKSPPSDEVSYSASTIPNTISHTPTSTISHTPDPSPVPAHLSLPQKLEASTGNSQGDLKPHQLTFYIAFPIIILGLLYLAVMSILKHRKMNGRARILTSVPPPPSIRSTFGGKARISTSVPQPPPPSSRSTFGGRSMTGFQYRT